MTPRWPCSISHRQGFTAAKTGLNNIALSNLARAFLPVAGTFITQHSITGQWSLRVSLDGQWVQTQSVNLQH